MNDPYLPPAAPSGAPAQQAGLSNEERTWALAAHLSALSVYFTGFGMILGPLIVWLVNKDSKPYAAAEAKEALNFNISWMIWGILWGIASFILTFVLVGIVMWLAFGLFSIIWTILCIIGAIKANEGQGYRYPLTIRFIS
jgi:uncharacterized Tic20 family protein